MNGFKENVKEEWKRLETEKDEKGKARKTNPYGVSILFKEGKVLQTERNLLMR